MAPKKTLKLKHAQPKRGRSDMPLVKSASKGAFRANLKAEIKAGKPKKQSLAIAYSVQRKAKKGKNG